MRARDAHYPVLLPTPAERAPGLLFTAPLPADRRRIEHFESGEYRPSWQWVRSETDGAHHLATVFMALASFRPSGEPWQLVRWAAAHKEAYLPQCDRWMATCRLP